jgi:hypothetical protein
MMRRLDVGTDSLRLYSNAMANYPLGVGLICCIYGTAWRTLIVGKGRHIAFFMPRSDGVAGVNAPCHDAAN